MDRCTLKVSLVFGDKVITRSINLDPTIIGRAMMPIDFPKPNSDVIEKMLCTDEVTISFVLEERKNIANSISDSLSKAIVDLLCNEDTIMGYPVKDNHPAKGLGGV